MQPTHLNFESFDGRLRQAAEDAADSLRKLGQGNIPGPVTLDPEIAPMLARFLNTALERGGIAYGPLGTEMSPNEAGRILGLSRPLVVRRMEIGDLPFHYVGAHRRCTLQDVLKLKARIDAQNRLMTEVYQDFEEIEDIEAEPAP